MTVKQIRQVVSENLSRAGLDRLPGPAELLGLINRAKDDVVAQMELLDEDQFTARQTYTVAASDASIDLPSDFRRLIALTRTDGGRDYSVEIINVRRRADVVYRDWPEIVPASTGDWPIMYQEGSKLYFIESTGAPVAMTLVLRYRQRIADATETAASLDAAYSGVDEWDRAIVSRATSKALPRANPEYERYANDYVNDVGLMEQALNRRISDKPMRVQMMDDW